MISKDDHWYVGTTPTDRVAALYFTNAIRSSLAVPDLSREGRVLSKTLVPTWQGGSPVAVEVASDWSRAYTAKIIVSQRSFSITDEAKA
jgi:hypothetical protein